MDNNTSKPSDSFTSNPVQPKYNKETEDALQEARDILEGKVGAKTYDSFKEVLDDVEDQTNVYKQN